MKHLKVFEEKFNAKDINDTKKYPELNEIVTKLSDMLLLEINQKTKRVKSEMPYKAQYVLEEIIKKLQAAV